jgi:signal transduction histidine kinase
MRRWWRRLQRADRRVVDRWIAAAFVVVGVIEALLQWDRNGSALPQVLGLAVGYSMLAWRRTQPVAAGAAMFATWTFANTFLGQLHDLQFPLIAVLTMSYAMGAYTDGRAALAAPFVILAGMLGVVLSFENQVFTDYIFPTAFALIAWLAGRGLRTRTRLTEELHEAAVQAREAHERDAAQAAVEERRRIAREMHDVVAHSVSVMVVQAGGARRILEHDPRRAVEAAAHIEEVGRAALTEMRRLLGVLHHGEEEAGRAPQPTLRELDALVARSRAAGLPVTLVVEGEPQPLPPGKDLAAYRVVQEALTNALKHAGSAPTSVTVRWEASSLQLQIVDMGGTGMNGTNGSGHGLIGMEERMRLYDGSLRAGPVAGGGFEVTARMPL